MSLKIQHVCVLVVLCVTLCFQIVVHANETPVTESQPAVSNGLSVTVTLKSPAFGADPQWPIFTVQFKNVSSSNLTLDDPGAYWDWQIRLAKKGAFDGWQVHFAPMKIRRLVSPATLKPGETLDVPVDLNQPPIPADLAYESMSCAFQPKKAEFSPGNYEMTVGFNFQADAAKYWTGFLKTNPVDIEHQDTDAIFLAAIQAVTDKFDKGGLWTNGLFPTIDLPANAQLSDLIDKGVKGGSQYKSYHVLDTRPVTLGSSMDPAYAAVLNTNDGVKVLLLHHFGDSKGWWSRSYDASLTLSATKPITK